MCIEKKIRFAMKDTTARIHLIKPVNLHDAATPTRRSKLAYFIYQTFRIPTLSFIAFKFHLECVCLLEEFSSERGAVKLVLFVFACE